MTNGRISKTGKNFFEEESSIWEERFRMPALEKLPQIEALLDS